MVETLKMIDVSEKPMTHRRAVATGSLRMGGEAFRMLVERRLPKGDPLAVADVAAVMAAKRTPDMVPLCHPIEITSARSEFELRAEENLVCVRCEVNALSRTGVEMEALAATTAALLAIYDLVKQVDPALCIEKIYLETKEGGKSGPWSHPILVDERTAGAGTIQSKGAHSEARVRGRDLDGVRAFCVTISDSAAKGAAADLSGPMLSELVTAAGGVVADTRIVSDDVNQICSAVSDAVRLHKVDLVLTTGGTGLGPRDLTPEALSKVCDRLVPGIGELLRSSGAKHTGASWLSRSVAGQIGQTLVIALPGKPSAVCEGMEVLLPILSHALEMIRGGGHAVSRHLEGPK